MTANPAALKIVLHNLLGNAAKFTRDSATPRARVGLRAEGSEARAHQRAGQRRRLRPGARRAAVQALRRLHARDDYAGSGIGLSIVQRIVERHGGRVEARAEAGRGACFEFTLPCSIVVPLPSVQHGAAEQLA